MRRRFFIERLHRRVAFGVALLVALGAVATSQAHFVVSRRSLRALIAESDLVVHARVVEVEKLVAVEGTEQWVRRPPSVEVLDIGAHSSRAARRASDHLPIVARVRV